MGRQTSDFVVDTVGHCFICMKTISPQPAPSGSSSSSICSMLYLSRYLKIRTRKVLNEDVPIPEDLLKKVEMATLKVSLCEECASWNSRLSELLQKLEKIEIEAASYLQLIHGKLQRAVQHDITDICSKLANRSESELIEKLQVAEVLRKETMERCSQKINGAQLTVKVRKLSEKDIEFLKQSRCNYFETSMEVNPERELNDVKLETFNSEGIWEESENDYLDDFEQQNEDSAQGNISSLVEHDSGSGSPEIRTTSSKHQKSYIRNSRKGKYECKLCVKKFTSLGTFNKHYQSGHLKHRYKCKICNKEFTLKGNLTTHQNSVHLKLQFKCQFCNKSFTSPTNRRRHIRLEVCKGKNTKKGKFPNRTDTGKYECKLCKKTFASNAVFHRHYQSIHLKLRFRCKSCDKEFTQLGHLREHQKSIHLKLRVKCQFCLKSFSSHRTKHRHISSMTCKGVKTNSLSERSRTD